MAASSPAKSNNGATDAAVGTPLNSSASKSLRGLNKPKCIKCGNVARSRCPYQSCKNCCAKAQNPCHIHVLKGNSSLPDKPQSSSSPLFDQQSSEVSHSGNSHRLRQLSNNFAQFSNLHPSFRARKPLTKKDAQVINEWRFLKLKEYRDGKIKAESEAFDRYMQNVGLLEEVFLINPVPDAQIDDEPFSDGENTEKMVRRLKLKLTSNPVRTDNLRKRIQYIVDQGLRKTVKVDLTDNTSELSDTDEPPRTAKKIKSSQGERVITLSDLSDKLNKARNEEDLKACWEAASQLFGWNVQISQMEPPDEQLIASKEKETNSLLPKWVTPSTIDQEALCRVDAQFSSLEEIEDL